MQIRNTRERIWLYSGLACAVLMLAAPTMAAAAVTTAAPAPKVATDSPPGYTTVSTNGISLPAGTFASGAARCPSGTVVLSGGAYIKSRSVKTGIELTSPDGDGAWFVVASNFSSAATTFNVYAVCATQPDFYAQVFGAAVSNPAGDQDSASVYCDAGIGDVVLGGGSSGPNVYSTSVGLTSSYPNGEDGWTATESNFSSGNVLFGAVVICGYVPNFPSYATPSTWASDPAGKQKGIVQKCAAPAVALGGGNKSSNTTNLRILMKATQPFPASGTGWKSGENNDTSAGTTLTSYAICAT
jgi:hypothetical protein